MSRLDSTWVWDEISRLLDDREPALCLVCGSVAFPMNSWVHVFPTRGMVLERHWLCNCGLRRLDLSLVRLTDAPPDVTVHE